MTGLIALLPGVSFAHKSHDEREEEDAKESEKGE